MEVPNRYPTGNQKQGTGEECSSAIRKLCDQIPEENEKAVNRSKRRGEKISLQFLCVKSGEERRGALGTCTALVQGGNVLCEREGSTLSELLGARR